MEQRRQYWGVAILAAAAIAVISDLNFGYSDSSYLRTNVAGYDRYETKSNGIRNGKYEGYFTRIGGLCLGYKNENFSCENPPSYGRTHKLYVDREVFESMVR